MSYEYTQENRLKSSHTYQFSSYGRDLLDAYNADRASVRAKLDAKVSLKDVLSKLARTDTAERALSGDVEILLRLVKKFEISKKLRAKYDKKWKIADEAFDDPSSYLCLSYACLLEFQQSRQLPLLNCVLKLNDTLCSLESHIEDLSDRAVLAAVLDLEREIVSDLYSSKGSKL
jgi:hypothetical protein